MAMRKSEYLRYKSRILSLTKSNLGVVTTSEIASALKISWNTAEKYMLELALDRIIQRIKKAGVNLWVLKK